MKRLDEHPLLLDDGRADPNPGARVFLVIGFAIGAGLLSWFLATLPVRDPILPRMVAAALDDSGVSNPVTAVLLNFRSYDTLLEVAVLVAAMSAAWSMDRKTRELTRPEAGLPDPVLEALARLVVPLAAATAVYLVWAGSHAMGGAFQAGALMAGAGVLLATAGFIRPLTAAWRPVRAIAAGGIYLFMLVGVAVIPWTGVFLQYPGDVAYPLIVGIEAVLAVSIAVVLVELFVDVPSVPDPDTRLEGIDPTGDPLGRLFDPEGLVEEGPEGRGGRGGRDP